MPLSRRDFLKRGAVGAVAAGALATPAAAMGRARLAAAPDGAASGVDFLFDGPIVDPLEYARRLVSLHEQRPAKSDSYMVGGRVQELEERFASELGKEAAVFLATGTLANHLAIRRLAGESTRVLVQAESHIYADSLDCVQALSRINLVPLAPGRATVTRDEVDEACRHAVDGPYPSPVGAMSIECPVRRRTGEVFDFEELKRISQYAKEHDLKLHLDGARLYIASAYTGIPPLKYAELVDTIYISLYKYLGAASGAILAGPKRIIEQVAHDRKVFGGTVYQAWPFAAVALENLNGFSDRYSSRRRHRARSLRASSGSRPLPHRAHPQRLEHPSVHGGRRGWRGLPRRAGAEGRPHPQTRQGQGRLDLPAARQRVAEPQLGRRAREDLHRRAVRLASGLRRQAGFGFRLAEAPPNGCVAPQNRPACRDFAVPDRQLSRIYGFAPDTPIRRGLGC